MCWLILFQKYRFLGMLGSQETAAIVIFMGT